MSSSQTVLVTGAGGFSGQHFVDFLKSSEPNVRIVGCGRSKVPACDEFHVIDLNSAEDAEHLIRQVQPDYLAHFAGIVPPARSETLWFGTLSPTYNVLHALNRVMGPKSRLLLIGSAAEYQANDSGEYDEQVPLGGVSEYGRVKSAQNQLAVAMAQCELVVARPFNLIGPGQSTAQVMGKVMSELASGRDCINLGRTDSIRDFIDIRDACRAYWNILVQGDDRGVYNVCSGTGTSIAEMVALAVKVSGRNVEVVSASSSTSTDRDCSIGVNHRLRQLGWSAEIDLGRTLSDMYHALL